MSLKTTPYQPRHIRSRYVTGGVESTPPLENTLGGVRDQLCFYRIMNLYKIRQNPKNQTPSFENGALKNFSNSNFFALSEMRKNMVPGENLHHSLKFLPFDLQFFANILFWTILNYYVIKMGCYRGSGDPFLKILGFLGFLGGYLGGPPQKKLKSENTKLVYIHIYEKSIS